ncbi:MAG: acetoacetate--CoA ligase, partial [Gammaproteobacteria bacterium]|nr:acetoacetate--CoA ligase [Gammaproteobacteria bacterium]NIR83022.1 acetoacetate--CoA ligase [Gammaproteobacteria bacterium]NIR90689.1 acetoacetate--CoA ligase [Gammaproteobacteria bacterium]NIU04177.1 acetoacetate--CoA ligase [Gammaproteobacteria bacterium]NIV51468.1 acetoacetate--CoA ligase [Gammaproteobacteria bacterium]
MTKPIWVPSPERVEEANITRFMHGLRETRGLDVSDYTGLYHWSIEHPEDFWTAMWDFGDIIAETRGDTVLQHGDKMPGARWFPDARLNFAENLLRRRDGAEALVFRGEDKVRRSLTFVELYEQVSRYAQALRAAGVDRRDRVAAYMPNMPETITAMLATTSIGAIWSSCSPDFGVRGVLDRFGQIEPKVLFAADGYFYNGKTFPLRDRLIEIVRELPTLEKVIIVPYASDASDDLGIDKATPLNDDFLTPHAPAEIRFERLPFNHPLYILYSSGTTGAPKCIVHGAGGTLIQHMKEHLLHTDIKRGNRLFYFTTCGWMMWNWLASGLAAQATLLLYDGSPFYPDGNVLFDFADDTGMTVFGASAKYIDAVKKAGLVPRRSHDLSMVRAMLSTGSPLVPESFDFVYESVKEDILLASISGGTDLISCFMLGCPILPVYRGEIQCRGLGMRVEIFDEDGHAVRNQKGELVCTAPFPSMPIGFWKDPEDRKYRAAYFEKYPGVWCHGDFVKLTPHDGIIMYGRSDSVLNPGGVRIGTAE